MDLVNPFLIGGSVIAGSKLVSKVAPTALAPLIGGMPTGIIASFFLDTEKEKREYYFGYVYSSFVLFLSVLVIHLWSINADTPMNIISGTSLIIWAVISYIIVNLFVIGVKKSKSKK